MRIAQVTERFYCSNRLCNPILFAVGEEICSAGGLTSAESTVAEARIQRDTQKKIIRPKSH